ncbi:MAG TPA: (2Fe-2S) ferredoxin domain-containing protein [Bacteroidia bacterium]|nr:(2Fe-2S) ferredoxin domain-containing protein [Bacteroidia bacterium]
MEKFEPRYEKHIFICTNQRAEGQRVCCGETHGLALTAAFKEAIKEKKLHVKMRAQKAGCFDICEFGPNVIVYPEGVYYGKVTLEDVNEIVEEHLLHNRPVERLRLSFQKKN